MKLENFPPVLWINLERSPDRRKRMEELLDAYRLQHHRINAVDGLNKTEMDKVCVPHGKMSTGANACSCSHLTAMKYFVEEMPNINEVVIFEDDVSFEFLEWIPYDWSHFRSTLPLDFKIIQLCIMKNGFVSKNLTKTRIGEKYFSSAAYLITRSAAKEILNEYTLEGKIVLRGKFFPTHLGWYTPAADIIILNTDASYSIPIFTYETFKSTIELDDGQKSGMDIRSKEQQLLQWKSSSMWNVFLYWAGHDNTLISLLRKLIYLHSNGETNYRVNLITEQNLDQYLSDLPLCFKKLSPVQQADYLRVKIINKYGGIWLDSDTLVMSDLSLLFNLFLENHGFFVREPGGDITNRVFGSKPQTRVMIEWENEIEKILEQIDKMLVQANNLIENDSNLTEIKLSTEIGSGLLRRVIERRPSINYQFIRGIETIIPVIGRNALDEFIIKPYENYLNIIRPNQPFVILASSVYKYLEKYTEQEILNGQMPINYFINLSLYRIRITEQNKELTNALDPDRCLSKKVEPHEKHLTRQMIFDYIYARRIWSNQDPLVPVSGPGSIAENAIKGSMMLVEFIYSNAIDSIADIGCGDLTWMSKTPFFNDVTIKYTGYDIVNEMIKQNKTKHLSKEFCCQDIVKTKIAYHTLVIIRDVIFHMKNEEILQLFQNLRDNCRYIAINSTTNVINTDDFNQWYWVGKNIHIEPFKIPEKYLQRVQEADNKYFSIYLHNDFFQNLK